MIGRDTFAALAPVLGPSQKKNWLCNPLPLLFMAVSMIPNTDRSMCVTFELLLHAAFVADETWGDTLEPARTYMNSWGWAERFEIFEMVAEQVWRWISERDLYFGSIPLITTAGVFLALFLSVRFRTGFQFVLKLVSQRIYSTITNSDAEPWRTLVTYSCCIWRCVQYNKSFYRYVFTQRHPACAKGPSVRPSVRPSVPIISKPCQWSRQQ